MTGKIGALIVGLFFFGAIAAQEAGIPKEITTVSGKVYKGVTLQRSEPDGLMIMHSGGIGKVKFIDLSPELQKKFGFTPEKAKAFEQREKARQMNLRKSFADAQNKEKQSAENKKSAVEAAAKARVNSVNASIQAVRNRQAEESEAAYDAMIARGFPIRLKIFQTVPSENGVLAQYQILQVIQEDYMSGAIRRTREVEQWTELSDEFVLVRNAQGVDGAFWEGFARRDGTFQYESLTGLKNVYALVATEGN